MKNKHLRPDYYVYHNASESHIQATHVYYTSMLIYLYVDLLLY